MSDCQHKLYCVVDKYSHAPLEGVCQLPLSPLFLYSMFTSFSKFIFKPYLHFEDYHTTF